MTSRPVVCLVSTLALWTGALCNGVARAAAPVRLCPEFKTPDPKPTPPVDKDGKKVEQPPLPPIPAKKGRIWVVTNDRPGQETVESRLVDIGLTDGIHTELLSDLTGTKVVIDETDETAAKKSRGPRMF